MVPGDLGKLHCTYRRYGIKVWFGMDKAPREHYEAQVIGPDHSSEATILALEVGFHSEHPKEADNEAVISSLLGSERAWRRQLGPEAVIGGFLGRAQHWRRVSEVWPDPDLSDPELDFRGGGPSHRLPDNSGTPPSAGWRPTAGIRSCSAKQVTNRSGLEKRAPPSRSYRDRQAVPVVVLPLRAGPGWDERPAAKLPSEAIGLSISGLPARL